jgi:hypothetical protein
VKSIGLLVIGLALFALYSKNADRLGTFIDQSAARDAQTVPRQVLQTKMPVIAQLAAMEPTAAKIPEISLSLATPVPSIYSEEGRASRTRRDPFVSSGSYYYNNYYIYPRAPYCPPGVRSSFRSVPTQPGPLAASVPNRRVASAPRIIPAVPVVMPSGGPNYPTSTPSPRGIARFGM